MYRFDEERFVERRRGGEKAVRVQGGEFGEGIEGYGGG